MEAQNKHSYRDILNSSFSINETVTKFGNKSSPHFNIRGFRSYKTVKNHQSSIDHNLNWVAPILSNFADGTIIRNFDPFDKEEFPTLSSKGSPRKKKLVSIEFDQSPKPIESQFFQGLKINHDTLSWNTLSKSGSSSYKKFCDITDLFNKAKNLNFMLSQESQSFQGLNINYDTFSHNTLSPSKAASYKNFYEEIDPDYFSNNSKVPNTKSAFNIIQGPYGMMEFLENFKKLKNKEISPTLNLGYHMNSLGLDYGVTPMFKTFRGPFADECGLSKFDNKKSDSTNLSNSSEDSLFYIFYITKRNHLLLEAAKELINRGWRYHVELKIWISQISQLNNYDRCDNILMGMFYYFDSSKWQRLAKHFVIDITKLEKGDFECISGLNSFSVRNLIFHGP